MCGRIKIKQGNINIPVSVRDIVRFEGGKGNCCYIFLVTGKSYKITGNIGQWMKDAEIISSGLFVHVHRSHLINYTQVVSYDRIHGVTLGNNEYVPLTGQGLEELEKCIFSENEAADYTYNTIRRMRRVSFQKRVKEDEFLGNDEEE